MSQLHTRPMRGTRAVPGWRGHGIQGQGAQSSCPATMALEAPQRQQRLRDMRSWKAESLSLGSMKQHPLSPARSWWRLDVHLREWASDFLSPTKTCLRGLGEVPVEEASIKSFPRTSIFNPASSLESLGLKAIQLLGPTRIPSFWRRMKHHLSIYFRL